MYDKVFENSDLFNIIINLCINNIELQLNNIELKLIYCTKLINNNKRIIFNTKRLNNSYRLYNFPLYTNYKLF
jgi:sortase (surface protein transpeptidase)